MTESVTGLSPQDLVQCERVDGQTIYHCIECGEKNFGLAFTHRKWCQVPELQWQAARKKLSEDNAPAAPTLLQKINILETAISDYKASIDRAEANLHPLKALRQFCQHDYEPAPPNYVHEGGVCRLCGGNELAMISRNYF